jgi:type IV fimbrial biogenesis protein FimT
MVELAVTMAITAILATIAVPAFSSLTATQRAKTVSSELFESLLKARSEAIKRNLNVTVSPNAGGWVSGWQTPDPANAANILDTRGAASGVTIAGPVSVTYRPSGRVLAGAAPSFLVTATAGMSTTYQCMSVDLTGRPYVVAASTC